MTMHSPPHPGEFILAIYLEPFGMSSRTLAENLAVSPSTLNRIITGKSGVSPEMALRLSKALGRTPESWLAMQDAPTRERILGWKDYTTICASAPSEVLTHIALGAADKLAARSLRIVLDNLALAEAFFARWRAVFQWNRPQAGSVALVGLRDRLAPAFCDELVAEQGVLLLPSTGLGFGDRHVRFGFGRLSFPDALEQLDRYLARQEQVAAAQT